MIVSAGEALEFEGLAGTRVNAELGCELMSRDAKSVISPNSGRGYVTIHVTKSAIPHCGILAMMPRSAKAKSFGADLVEGMKLVLAHQRGTVLLEQVGPKPIDVKAIRKRVKMSQAEFSSAYGISKRALQEWEQGGPAARFGCASLFDRDSEGACHGTPRTREAMSGKPNLTERGRLRHIVASDPEIMGGASVFRGTRIPVGLIADMLAQGATAEEILEGYPTLDKEKIALEPLCTWAFPARKATSRCPWSGKKPRAERSFPLSDLLRNGR